MKKKQDLKKNKRARQNEQPQIKDVSDFTEVPQERDIPIYGHTENESKSQSQPSRKNECLMQRIVRITS